MSDVRMPLAMRADDGRIVGIDTVIRGLGCNCICPECSGPLVAVKGEVYRHHFRHAADTVTCIAARETALHKFAKQVICEACDVTLPDDLGSMQKAQAEVWLDGIRPDVLASYDSETVAIEIYVAHRVPREKLEKIYDREQTTVEIDLSYFRDAELTEDQLRKAVLWSADRRWLYDPLHVRRQRQEAYERDEAEGRRLLAEMRREKAEFEAARDAAALKQAAAWEAQRLIEAERRAKIAEEAVRREQTRQSAKEAEARLQAREEAERRQLAEIRLGPNLQKLVAAHGGYDKITPEAWDRFQADKRRWLDRLRHGELV